MSSTHALRQFLADAQKLGFTLDGYNGEGHPRLRHTNGQTIAIARTPSDWRGRRNELARLERIAGQKLPRANAAHYHRQRTHINSLHMTDHERQQVQRIDTLIGAAQQLRRRWADITTQPPGRDGAATARKILADYESIRTELAEHHRHIPPITATGITT